MEHDSRMHNQQSIESPRDYGGLEESAEPLFHDINLITLARNGITGYFLVIVWI